MFKMTRIENGEIIPVTFMTEPLSWIGMWFSIKWLAIRLTGNIGAANLKADGEIVVTDADLEEYFLRSMHCCGIDKED